VKIDAHVHVWGPAELEAYTWMTPELDAIQRPFTVDELRPLLAAHDFDGAVLVQTYASVEETRKLLALSAADDAVAGVVGWVDLTSPDVAETLADLHGLAGVRHQVHDEADPEWLLRDDVRRGLRAVEEAGLAYDLLVRPRELPAALATAREFAGLPMVIDHLAKPPIASGDFERWAERMAPFAELEHVSCKVSGLVTEADWSDWSVDALVAYVHRVVEWFGEDRILFGSDWPVCTLAASYDEVVIAAERALERLSREKVFGGNAAAVYRLMEHPNRDLPSPNTGR
jgi:L-fuconolactonase